MLQHTFTMRRRHSCANTDTHSQRFPVGNQTRDNLFCHTLISTSLTLSQSPVILSSSSSSLVSSLLLKDSISNLYILLMSALLLLKILSPNQIYQLAPMLLLLFALVSVKPRKLDLLSGSLSSSSFLLFHFVHALPRFSPPSGKASLCAFLPLCPCQLHPACSLSLLRMTSLPSVIFLCFSPPSLMVSCVLLRCFVPFFFFVAFFLQAACPLIAPLLLLLRQSSVHAAGEPVTDENACLSLC